MDYAQERYISCLDIPEIMHKIMHKNVMFLYDILKVG